VTEKAPAAQAKGEPDTCVSAPVPRLIENTETLLLSSFATYTSFPDGSNVTDVGNVPAENGEPDMGVRAPVPAVIVYAETLLLLALAT